MALFLLIFIQFSKVSVKSDLNITCQLIHSFVLCLGYINVKDDSGQKGAVFGGFLCAQKGLNTVTLGAIAGVNTTIDLIGPYHQLLERKKETLASILELKEKVENAVSVKAKLNTSTGTENERSLNKRLTLTIIDAKKTTR